MTEGEKKGLRKIVDLWKYEADLSDEEADKLLKDLEFKTAVEKEVQRRIDQYKKENPR